MYRIINNYEKQIKIKIMANKTAVQWLAEQMLHPELYNPYIEEALQMERMQIISTYIDASPRLEDITKGAAEDYYERTFNL